MRDTLPMILAAAPMKAFAINGAAEITIQAAAEGEPKKRPTFSISAYNGGAINVGYYGRCVVDLKGLRASGPVPILLDHDATQIVGQGKAKISREGVTVDGQITGDDEPAAKVTMHAKNGFRWSASVGVAPEKIEYVGEGKFVKVNGQEFTGPIQVCRAGRLGEVSFVAVGADETATASIAASAAKGQNMSFEQWLKARGLTLDGMSEAQQTALKASYDAEISAGIVQPVQAAAPVATPVVQPAAPDITASIAENRKALAAEANRVGAIQKLCGGKHAEIEAKAISEGWDTTKAELEVLRASRSAPVGFVKGARPDVEDSVILEASLCMSLAIPGHEKQFKPEVLEAAQRHRNIGINEALMLMATANGYRAHPGQRVDRGNIGEVLKAAFSTGSTAGILSNVANKELLAGYMEEDQTWREVSVVKSVRDFKQVTSYRLLDNMEYEQVAPTGELKHGTIGEESYTRQADTYGKMFTLTRKNIIDDDMGALDDIRTRLGAGAAKKLNNIFWAAFMNNATFFTAARGNYISGSTTNLAVDGVGLELGIKGFRLLKSPAPDGQKKVGSPVGGRPEILLVPPELEFVANRLYQSTDIVGSTQNLNANIHAGKYKPVVSPWLSDSAYTGYSATAWYLLRNPGVMAACVVSFLNGQQAPTVEQAEADFNVLGIQFRGFHDFGVDQAEYLCGIKSKGTA